MKKYRLGVPKAKICKEYNMTFMTLNKLIKIMEENSNDDSDIDTDDLSEELSDIDTDELLN